MLEATRRGGTFVDYVRAFGACAAGGAGANPVAARTLRVVS